ncbi:sodium/bile acid cotransporter 4 [Lampetra planeri]
MDNFTVELSGEDFTNVTFFSSAVPDDSTNTTTTNNTTNNNTTNNNTTTTIDFLNSSSSWLWDSVLENITDGGLELGVTPPTASPPCGSSDGEGEGEGGLLSTIATATATTGPTVSPIWDSPLNPIISVYVAVVLAFTMLGMGCTVELGQLSHHLRRPAGVLIAALAQFAVMPFVAFAMANAFALGEAAAVAVLVCGCCPGGTLSNIMSLFIDGDMNLSIIMTASSALLALPLMPLCLWVYSRHWLDTPVVQMLPFGAIALTLCGTLVPLAAGAALRHRAPGAADVILKVSVWLLLPILGILFILTGSLLGPDLMGQLPATVYLVAVLMPLVGYGVGFGLARLCRLPPSLCRTISMETGCQNVQLCTAILKLTFHPEAIGAIFLFPLLYALFQAAEAGLFIVAYRVRRARQRAAGGRAAGDGGDDDDDDEGGSDITYRKLKEDDGGLPREATYGSVDAKERHAGPAGDAGDDAVRSTYV